MWRAAASAAVAALAALVAFALTADKSTALTWLPRPLGLGVYLARGGDMPPFLNMDVMRNETEFRKWAHPGDVIVSACGKCGNTWLMNIVHQIRARNDAEWAEEFGDIMDVAPWPLLRTSPGSPPDEYWAAMEPLAKQWWSRRGSYRVFKAQNLPSDSEIEAYRTIPGLAVLPIKADLKYVVGVRDPLEQVESALHFIRNLNPEHGKRYGIVDIEAFAGLFGMKPVELLLRSPGVTSAQFLHGWARHLCDPNVFLVHYTDLKKDTARTLRELAGFLGEQPTSDEWVDIERRVGFKWMKENGDKFLYRIPGQEPLTKELVRSGTAGGKQVLLGDDGSERVLDFLAKAVPADILAFARGGGDVSALKAAHCGG